MNTESSSKAVMGQFQSLSETGQSVMDDIQMVQTETLLAFEQFLSQANLLKTRISRICSPGILGRFVVSDVMGVDLPHTTATVRPDATAATLAGRGEFVPIAIKSTTFSTDRGTYQLLNNTYKVMSQDGTPTGTFRIDLVNTVLGNLVVFDIVTSSPDGSIAVSGVGPDLSEFPADSISRNGYRVCAWLPEREMKSIKIALTPTGPDIAGGLGYTFGITDLNASSVSFHLASELAMDPVSIVPTAPKAVFRAPEAEGLEYFLSYDGEHYQRVAPGSVLALPGCVATTETDKSLDGTGKIDVTLPVDLVKTSLVVRTGGADLPVLFNLHSGETPASDCAVVDGADLLYRPFNSETDAGKLFTVLYYYGPASLQVWLKVKFAAASKTLTPVFSGAYLEESHE